MARRTATAAGVVLLAAAALAQEQPVFRASTTLVTVDVIVTDREGRFVRDLGLDDFELLDEGAPQAISAFALVDSAAPAAPAGSIVPLARTAVAATPGPATSPGRVLIFFFDTAHLSPGPFRRLHEAAAGFIASSFTPFDIGGVVSRGTMIDGRLTSNAGELTAALKKARLPSDQNFRRMDLRDWPRFISEVEAWRVERGDEAAFNQVVQRARADEPGVRDVELIVKEKAQRLVNDIRQATGETLNALRSVAGGLARLQGRKTVFFLSEGLFIEESWAILRQIVDDANRAGVTMYSLDARGLDRTAPGRDVRDAFFSETDMAPLTAYDSWRDAPNSLAVDTGGLVLRNTNDFAGALMRAAEDTSRYYLLGYSWHDPSGSSHPSGSADGRRFHRIEVRVKRPGLVVRSRKAYAAGASPTVPATSAAPTTSDGVKLQPDIVALQSAPLVREYLQRVSNTPPEPVIARAANLALEGHWAEVELAVETAARESAAGFVLAGLARFAMKDYARAAEAFDRAVPLAAGDPLPSFLLGWARATAGQEREAIGAFRYAAVVDSRFLAAHLALADAYIRLGERALAIQAVRAGLAALPESPELREKLAMLEKPQQP